ncbi:uncharacterized protein KY384_008193 [Bacidia gigantensis]|uniref:uncharacterized protein n=1 Tax=Bacidia gigantensis TaxID=2732470 RepID=UPI001D04FD5A|nr:uncharacterized protein KY384_008193 [Bacidia gigantensis]KAG8526764.1 hypothetical protein KY384_008193 [Bacidia gigantensis]
MSSFFQKHIKRASQEAKQEFQGTPKDPVTSARHSQPLNIFKRSVSNLRVTKSLKKSTSSTSTNQSTSNSLRKRVEEVRSEVLPGKKRSTVENEKRLLMDENAHVPQKQDRPPDLRLEYSNFSSFEKLTPDSSGLATLESSHPTTPSPAKPSKESAIGASELSEEDMGQRNSTVRRKPIPLNQKPSLDCFTISPPMSPNTSSVQSSAEMHPPLAVLTNRPASVQMPIPRRRSSLTALHLDSSHFDRPLSSRDGTKHRASTLTNTFPQFSPINLAPLEKAALRPTFSPPLRPPVSNGRPASSSSMALSTSSPAPPFIHLPKTFPNGPVEVRAPSLRDSHHHCIQGHRKMPRSNNKICPTPFLDTGKRVGKTIGVG